MESSFYPHLLDETSNIYKMIVSNKVIQNENENDFTMYSHVHV